jgi:hypothetical protein
MTQLRIPRRCCSALCDMCSLELVGMHTRRFIYDVGLTRRSRDPQSHTLDQCLNSLMVPKQFNSAHRCDTCL